MCDENADRQAHLRWGERSIAQVGIQNTVLITLAAGGTVLLVPLLFSAAPLPNLAVKTLFAGLTVMVMSIGFGVFVLVNRAKAFRVAARIA